MALSVVLIMRRLRGLVSPPPAPGLPWIVLSADGTPYTISNPVLAADGTPYTVPGTVLGPDGTSYTPI